MSPSALPFPEAERWFWRWEQFATSAVLHRIAMARMWYAQDGSLAVSMGVDGRTACGMSGRLFVPGVGSRLGAPRCRSCCRALGIPWGEGAPYNQAGAEWRDA